MKKRIHWTLYPVFILVLILNSYLFAQGSLGEMKKIHLLPVKIKPNDTYIESQVIKSALRSLYRTGKYQVLVGESLNYKKIVIGVETLLIEAKRFRNKYEITLEWREQKKGRILKKIRVSNVLKKNFLFKVEEMLQKVFDPDKLIKNSTVVIAPKTSEKEQRPPIGNLTVRDTFPPVSVDSNVVVLTPDEVNLKRNDPEKYFQAREKRRKKKQWGREKVDGSTKIVVTPETEKEVIEPEPEYQEEKEKVYPRVIAKKEIPPKPIPPKKKIKKQRKPKYLSLSFYGDYQSLTTDDLLTGVKTNILRYGAYVEPHLWHFSKRAYFYGRGQILGYAKKATFRNIQKRMPVEWKLDLGYKQAFFNKALEAHIAFSKRNLAWTNLARAFAGLEIGELRSTDIELGMSMNFKLFKVRHGLGFEYSHPVMGKVKYAGVEYKELTSSRYKVFYDYHLGENSRLRLGYSKRALEITNKPSFKYDSSVISLQMIINMSI